MMYDVLKTDRLSFILLHSSFPVERHHFPARDENFADAALVRVRENFKTVGAALFELLLLHRVEGRQVLARPFVLDRLQWILFSERMPLPIRRQKQPPQVWMIFESH